MFRSFVVIVFISSYFFEGLLVANLSLQETVKEVHSCPKTKKEWLKASIEKNCSALHSSQDVKYEYLCVINEWGNSTIEVCTVNRNILFGKCAEYNYGAKRIQSSNMKLCSNFGPPCPVVYNSSDSYMYQGCYDFLKSKDKQSTSNLNSNFSNSEISEEDFEIMIIVLISAVITLSVFVSIIIWKRYSKWKNHNTDNTSATTEEESRQSFVSKSSGNDDISNGKTTNCLHFL
ncbi:uncharacterized protein LOC134278314 [Saccostrea cucullata]|uniref:uncharacterized protein LOC134250700 n=1 Tax=Saccostrea cuccullata TaxID=36930 RepID=UPI002ED1D2B0